MSESHFVFDNSRRFKTSKQRVQSLMSNSNSSNMLHASIRPMDGGANKEPKQETSSEVSLNSISSSSPKVPLTLKSDVKREKINLDKVLWDSLFGSK